MDGLREQLEFVWDQQWDVVWRNYIHELFQHKDSKSDVRQRHLALDLGTQRGWVPLSELKEMTLRLAGAYASKTSKTIQRDLNTLMAIGLIAREGNKIRAKREIIQFFLPFRRTSAKTFAENTQ